MPSPSENTAPRLSVRDLRKRFGARPVLDGLDLDVAPGQVALLAGSNGSGKTTLLRCVAGLARFDGEVLIDGVELTGGPADRRHLGYLPQVIALPEWATVAETLALFARLRDTDPRSPLVPASFLPDEGARIGQLSGGQRQRVAIAIALLGAPRLLLLDEPAANLDDEGRQDLFEVLARTRDLGTSALVAAPSPADLNGLPDVTVRLRDGRVVDDPNDRPEPTHIERVHEFGGMAS